ncbi:MAG TPA: pilus assembly protein TadG-related protein, partial [Dermatophilaceae bacterium]|nr:pilus assembly protein TadG-related protein [Dermatophilaceae bacterium]
MKTVRMLVTAGVHRLDRLSGRGPADDGRMRERGQVLAIFAVMSVVLLGGAALVTDVTNWWMFEQRLQRAADAAALAGAVYMPDYFDTKATPAAIAEAKRNGFDDALPNVVVTPRRDPTNARKLIVDIDAPVQTNFARVFCWEGGPCLDQVDVGVTGAAEYVLPVPMGSPENYYGVFGTLRGATFTEWVEQTNVSNTNPDPSSGWRVATTAPAATPVNSWTASSGTLIASVNANNNVYARTAADGAIQPWGTFGIVTPTGGAIPVPAANQVFTITGIEVRLSDAFLSGSCSNSRIRA